MLKISRRWFGDTEPEGEDQYLTMRQLFGDTLQYGRNRRLVYVSDSSGDGDATVPLNGTLEISYIDPALAMVQQTAAEAAEMEAAR